MRESYFVREVSEGQIRRVRKVREVRGKEGEGTNEANAA